MQSTIEPSMSEFSAVKHLNGGIPGNGAKGRSTTSPTEADEPPAKRVKLETSESPTLTKEPAQKSYFDSIMEETYAELDQILQPQTQAPPQQTAPTPDALPTSPLDGFAVDGDYTLAAPSTDIVAIRRTLSLHSLSCLGVQLLLYLLAQPSSDTTTATILQNPPPELMTQYLVVKRAFEEAKRLCSDGGRLLIRDDLGIADARGLAMVRMSNLATFASDVLLPDDNFADEKTDTADLADHFLEILPVDALTAMPQDVSRIFLELQTQSFIDALRAQGAEAAIDQLIEQAFASSSGETFLQASQRPELSQGQSNFLTLAAKRQTDIRQIVTEAGDAAIEILEEAYPRDDFFELVKHYSIGQAKAIEEFSRSVLGIPLTIPGVISDVRGANGAPGSSVEQAAGQETEDISQQPPDLGFSLEELEALVNSVGHTRPPVQDPDPPGGSFENSSDIPLPPSQSMPSSVLYAQARQLAASKHSSVSRKEGKDVGRQPWSQEEELTLMKGLDMVQGPHWSKILGLFGKGGTISEVLAKRTQVQLKDKARNLKLFFLKSGTEMPVYLKLVTGELKTRAPQTAARREAEAAQARARLNSSEEGSRREGLAASPATGGGTGVPLLPAGAAPLAPSGQQQQQRQQQPTATYQPQPHAQPQPAARPPNPQQPPIAPAQPQAQPQAQPSTTLTPHAAAAAMNSSGANPIKRERVGGD